MSDDHSDHSESELSQSDDDTAEELYIGFAADDDDVEPADSALGAPVWLIGNGPKELRCCGVLRPLLQLYAPTDDRPRAHHRTLSVLACEQCGVVHVLRAQAPETGTVFVPPSPASQCFCGLPGAQRCAQCGGVAYCSRAHQRIDWRARHKAECAAGGGVTAPEWKFEPSTSDERLERCVQNGFERVRRRRIDTEPEPTMTERQAAAEEHARREEEAALKLVEEAKKKGGPELPTEELEAAAAGAEARHDARFERFQRRIRAADDQVSRPPERCASLSAGARQILRYWHFDGEGDVAERGLAQVVWPTSHAPALERAADVPACGRCGAARRFELQLLPQLLHYVNVAALAESKIDFATAAVFTCSDDCELGDAYAAEHVFVQQFREASEVADSDE